MIGIPDEVVLAVRFELGLASWAELADLVDRRLERDGAPTETLLELATPGDMPPDDVARRLWALSGVDAARCARDSVVVVNALLAADAITLDHGIAYVCVRVAPALGGELASRCGGLDDAFALARLGTWGTEAEVRAELAAIADACARDQVPRHAAS